MVFEFPLCTVYCIWKNCSMIPIFAMILLYIGSRGTSKVMQGVCDNMSVTETCIQMKKHSNTALLKTVCVSVSMATTRCHSGEGVGP